MKKQIKYSDCKDLCFKRINLNDEVAKKQNGFDDFVMELKIGDDYLLDWFWEDKKVVLYQDDKLVMPKVEITDLQLLEMFIYLANDFDVNSAIDYLSKNQTAVKSETSNIKKELEFQITKFTDGDVSIYLQKDSAGNIKIRNKFKNEFFSFQNAEISKKVCELIIYAFDNI